MAASIKCDYCSSYQIESCKQQGELICRNCGAVLQENTILEDVQYAETASGNATLVGQFIPTVGSRRLTLAFGSWQTREQVIKRGYHNIQRIADYLNLSTEHIESAQRIYLLAVQRNFTMGRNNLHVASCCLYTICRREKTPYLLIDFSDILQTPVKAIGQVFMKLVRMLHIQVPNVDPSIFFERFASQLHLKDKVQKIISTGIRLIQAMNRDWICTGRRPTGLCGAALVVAARFHGIPLNAEDVANVVRVSHPTIMKRLSEFKSTSTARLKSCEFDVIDLTSLPSNKLPPCLISRMVAKERATMKSGLASPVFTSECDKELELMCTDRPSPSVIDELASKIVDSLGNANDGVDVSSFSTLVGNTSTPPPRTTETSSDILNESLQSAVYIPDCINEQLSSDDEDDEHEFNQMILTQGEKTAKTLLWDEVTKDIMPQVWRRQMERKRKMEIAKKKRKYNRRNYQEYPAASCAADSARMALERHAKKFVHSINHNVLDVLLN